VSSTYFEHPSVHPQEDLSMQFYDIAFINPYQYQEHPAVYQTACADARKKCHKTCSVTDNKNDHIPGRNWVLLFLKLSFLRKKDLLFLFQN
jgi:hypothetical protein